MKRNNNKMVDKSEKMALLKDLVSLLPDIRSKIPDVETDLSAHALSFPDLPYKNRDLIALISLSGPLYSILGAGNKLIHQIGYFYTTTSKDDFVSQLLMAAEAGSEVELIISRYLDDYVISNADLDDLWIYDMILNKLRQLNFDLEYIHDPVQENTTEDVNLQRVNRLIESLKNFLAGDALKDKFMDEYILLNVLNLPRLQKEVQDQMLFKIFGDLAPSKLLVAYYKVYQKLPVGHN